MIIETAILCNGRQTNMVPSLGFLNTIFKPSMVRQQWYLQKYVQTQQHGYTVEERFSSLKFINFHLAKDGNWHKLIWQTISRIMTNGRIDWNGRTWSKLLHNGLHKNHALTNGGFSKKMTKSIGSWDPPNPNKARNKRTTARTPFTKLKVSNGQHLFWTLSTSNIL